MAKEMLQEGLRTQDREPISDREVLTRGVEQIIPDKHGLEHRMDEGPIRLYLGVDPTGELHIGHSVQFRKLRQFQELGHQVVFLFGDFTALIGDPTDKTASRVRQTPEQVAHHMRNYLEEVGKILDLTPGAKNPIEIRNNSEWLAKLTLEEILDIQAHFTVQQMLERSMFQQRIADGKPISLTEFSYPWMQGYDAVALNVDLEIGGNDQLFNMLVGRDLVRFMKGHEKWVMANKLIADPDGKKMGKTEGNIVNMNEWPEVKYEAVMTWPDSAIGVGFELLTSLPMDTVYQLKEEILPAALEGKGDVSLMDLKAALAYRVVAELDGAKAAQYAEDEFTRVKRQKQLPQRMKEIHINPGDKLIDILIKSGLAKDENTAQRHLATQAVLVNGVSVRKNMSWGSNEGTIQIGARTIKNIRKIVLG
jgi:tyrosyl-tRNA synthetase